MYERQSIQRVKTCQVGTLAPTLTLEGLADLLEALSIELGTAGGLIPLWANELQRELTERLGQ